LDYSPGVFTRRLSITLLTAICACALLYAKPAFAYVDPNIGGLLFQIFAPVFAVIIAFWGRIKFFCALALAKLKSFFARKP
jgi:amino acid permease